MGPKVEAACRFVEATGRMAAIGRLDATAALLRRAAGTIVSPWPGRSIGSRATVAFRQRRGWTTVMWS